MEDQEAVLLASIGVALIVFGHRLLNAELGRLGAPHLVGAVLVAAAMRVD